MKPLRETLTFTPEQDVPPRVAPFSHATRCTGLAVLALVEIDLTVGLRW